MTTTRTESSELQLLMIQYGKYYVKIPDVDIPIALNDYLYNKWSNQVTEEPLTTEENTYPS